jgi:hypothetical protein
MHNEMLEQIAEKRGYDRGFTAGTKHAHDLINQYIDWVKEYCHVLEEEGDCSHEIACYSTQINSLNYAKYVIRKGHWNADEELPCGINTKNTNTG